MVYVGVVVIVVFVPKGCVYLLITSKGWAQTSEHLSFASNLRFLAFIPFSCVFLSSFILQRNFCQL